MGNDTMIPPVTERGSRPCREWTDKNARCVFLSLSEFGAHCNLTEWPQTEDDMDEILRPVTCDFHFTRDEMTKLIRNQGTLPTTINKIREDIEMRRDELKEQLSEGEITRRSHDSLYAELGWVLQVIDHHTQQDQS